MTEFLSGPGYADACRRYREHVTKKHSEIVADIRRTGRRLRVGHHVSWTHQYFPSLAQAFLDSADSIEYEILHDIQIPAEIDALVEQGLTVYPASDVARVKSHPYDILFLQHPYFHIGDVAVDFYGIMRPLAEHVLSRDANNHPLLCFVPYAFTVIDERHHKPIDGFHDLPIHNVAWRVYCETPWHLERAKLKATLGADNWVVSGYPKLDQIVELAKAPRLEGPPRIIWAPHHNPNFQGIPIPELHRFLVALLDKVPGLQVVFRPHPNLIKSQSLDFSQIGMTSEQFAEILAFWRDHDSSEFNFTSDLAALFRDSDLMITDCGGFQAEYLYSGKPLISYIKRSLLNPFAIDVIDRAGYWASSIADVEAVVHRLLVDKVDDKLDVRREACHHILPVGGAGRAIVEDIKAGIFGASAQGQT